MLQRYKLVLEYLGTDFCGWQTQINGISVQKTIEDAIYAFSGQRTKVVGAGRTDAGVHAYGQVAHFDLEITKKTYNPETIIAAINHFVRPHNVSVLFCAMVEDGFHARFSAKKRSYVYKIINRAGKPSIDKDLCWWIRDDLNVDAMVEASKFLVGQHDFTSFRASFCQAKSPIRTVEYINIRKFDESNFYSVSHICMKNCIFIDICAKSFLHHMVRNIVGSLVNVGIGKWHPAYISKILNAKSREVAGVTAPAHGLYFLSVEY